MNQPGLRERKRAAVLLTAERAAVDLALEHGYEHTTIEMICAASDISPRTFFNYFGTKESAFLGATSFLPQGEPADAFVRAPGTDVLRDFLAMITTALVENEQAHDLALFRDRRTLLRSTPELANVQIARMSDVKKQMSDLVLRRVSRDAATVSPELEDEAQVIVAVALGVMHLMMQRWLREDFVGTLPDLVTDAIAQVHRLTEPTHPKHVRPAHHTQESPA